MLKKKDLIVLYNGLNSVGNLVGVFFGYAVNRNLEKMRPEIEALQKAVTPSKEFTEYDVKRVEIVKKYAKKDEKTGEFIIKDKGVAGKESYDVGDNAEVVEKEVGAFKEENKAVVEAHEKKMEEYNALLEQDSTVELYKVKLENVPKEITASQMAAVFPIVEEN